MVSLENDEITFEKVKTNIMKNSNTILLTATNQACNIISQYCVETLFKNQPIVVTVINGNKQVISIYKNEAMIITENRYYKVNHFYFDKCFWYYYNDSLNVEKLTFYIL